MERSYDFGVPAKDETKSYEELVTEFLGAQVTNVVARPLVTLEDLEVGTIQRIGKVNY